LRLCHVSVLREEDIWGPCTLVRGILIVVCSITSWLLGIGLHRSGMTSWKPLLWEPSSTVRIFQMVAGLQVVKACSLWSLKMVGLRSGIISTDRMS
jgi:hypothetical protein